MIKQVNQKLGWVSRLLLLVGIFFAGFGTVSADSSVKSIATLDERIDVARNSFEDIYYELVKQGFFDVYYNNNLVISTKINERFVKEGEVLLYLIDWLDKRNDRDSRYLLKKVSKFLYLEFYQLLCQIDAQKNQSSNLLRMLKDLYKYKVATPYGVVAPYRAVLSKMIVLTFMINLNQLSYEKKREAMAYTLHKIENSFLTVNASLSDNKLSDESIKAFIQLMQTFITREPLVKPSMVKGVVVTAIVLLAIAGIGFTLWYCVIPNWDRVAKWMGEVRDNCFRPIGEGMGDGLKKSLLDDPVLLEQLGNRIVRGMAVRDGQPNPDLAIVSNQIGNGIVSGMARDAGGAPNPDVAILRDQLTTGIADRVAREVANAIQESRASLPWIIRPPAPPKK